MMFYVFMFDYIFDLKFKISYGKSTYSSLLLRFLTTLQLGNLGEKMLIAERTSRSEAKVQAPSWGDISGTRPAVSWWFL